MIWNIVSYLLISLGIVILFAASVALYRFPDIYMRLHASSKASTGGTLTLLMGILMQGVSLMEGGKIILVIALILITAPVTTHAIARAAHVRGDSGAAVPFTDHKGTHRGDISR